MRSSWVLAIVVLGCGSSSRAPAEPPQNASTAEAQAQACERGDAAACLALGVRYYRADGIGDRDNVKADELFARACELEDLEGCAWHGVILMNGEAGTLDQDRALALLRPACDRKVERACVGIALLEYQGAAGLTKDVDKALATLGALCDGGNGVACSFLAGLWLQDPSLGDETKALPFAQRGCDVDNAFACFWLGLMTYNGIGTPADMAGGFQILAKACDLGEGDACATYGVSLLGGHNITKDVPDGMRRLRRGCQLASYKSCRVLAAQLQIEPGDDAGREAVRVATRACDGADLGGCAVLGISYMKGIGVAVDHGKAVALFRRACEGGKSESDGGGGGCFYLATSLYTGNGVAQDHAEAAQRFETACERGWGEACAAASDQYSHGDGVTADPARAAALLAKACEHGHEPACAAAGK